MRSRLGFGRKWYWHFPNNIPIILEESEDGYETCQDSRYGRHVSILIPTEYKFTPLPL
jgi:hypothetical protein